MLRGLGLDGGLQRKTDKDGNPEPGSRDSDSKNNEKAEYGSKDTAKNAINDDNGFKRSFDSGSNANNQGDKKNNAVGKTIENGGKSTNQNQQNGGNGQGDQNQQNNQNNHQNGGGNNK